MKKRTIVTAVSALLIVTATGAFAQSVLTPEQQEFYEQREERVNELVDEGKVTQEKADEYLNGLEERLIDGTCDGTGANAANGEGCQMGFGANGAGMGLGKGAKGQGQGNGMQNRRCGGNGCLLAEDSE